MSALLRAGIATLDGLTKMIWKRHEEKEIHMRSPISSKCLRSNHPVSQLSVLVRFRSSLKTVYRVDIIFNFQHGLRLKCQLHIPKLASSKRPALSRDRFVGCCCAVNQCVLPHLYKERVLIIKSQHVICIHPRHLLMNSGRHNIDDMLTGSRFYCRFTYVQKK